jgi:multidrug efflux system membrane fusion protein
LSALWSQLSNWTLGAAYARALERRRSFQKAKRQVELADTDRRIRRPNSPDLNWCVSYDSFFNQQLLPSNLAQVGLQLKWEPFDWGRKKRELASKTLAIEQAQLVARDQKNRVLTEVSRAFRQVQEARALVAVRRISHEGAQERVRVTLLRAAQQAVLAKDVLSAQAAQADAPGRSTTRPSFRSGRRGPTWTRPWARTSEMRNMKRFAAVDWRRSRRRAPPAPSTRRRRSRRGPFTWRRCGARSPRAACAIRPRSSRTSRCSWPSRSAATCASCDRSVGRTACLRSLQQGDVVARGTVLARLNSADYDEQVNQAKAQLADAEASLQRARADVARAESLYAEKALTRPDYDGAIAGLKSASARADAGRAQLEAAQLQLRDSAIMAPADGVVLSRSIEVGTLANPGTAAFVLADLSRVKAVFGVPDSTVQLVNVGAPFAITSDALRGRGVPRPRHRGLASADAQSRVFNIEVTIPNADRRLKAGMIASVEVGTPSAIPAGSPTVSVAAVVKSSKPGRSRCSWPTGGRRRHRPDARRRRSGAISGNRVAVSSGLSVGERVIVSGASLLTSGDRVRVIPGARESSHVARTPRRGHRPRHAQHGALLHRDAPRRLGDADLHAGCGASTGTFDAAAQGPGHPDPRRGGAGLLAGATRREDRAAGHAPDRGEDRGELEDRQDHLQHPHRRLGDHHRAAEGGRPTRASSSTTSS